MKARLGQHFLVDDSVLIFEAEQAQAQGKSVLEVGAGDGRLTEKLLSAGAAHITAVELDSRLAKSLREKFRRAAKVEIWQGDFLKFPQSRRFDVVVGNIPYYITSPILLKLARMEFGRAVLCMQREVAERLVAGPGTREYGRLSVFAQLSFRAEVLAHISRFAFHPVPKVDSCIVLLEKSGFSLSEQEERTIGAIFSHRKKTLRNAVVDARREIFGSDDKAAAMKVAQTLKYSKKKVFSLSPLEVLESARQLI
ncbi:MAG: 16S rRNA (adenine(1518)-N(6)/adenine(1519)-N(6))-dimethyltransferase RsmA [Candidatus Micrarchaeota archaeon]|nr:16S rRNA (adenine(1518)-N(6)/adenine(1519)-N(6))-dimethyltransferase RsmA [Candidatus Micrarchaeota archaeon]